MNAKGSMAKSVDPQWKGMYRLGAISAFLLVIGWLLITALYIPVYPFPEDGQGMLEYLNGKTTVWWAIIGVSALTDFLYALIAFSLYQALKGVSRNVMVVATGSMFLFAFLELAISWPNYAALIELSNAYAAASADVQRAAYAASASNSTAIVNSTVLGVYAIALPALGTLLVGLVMRKGIFNKVTAYMGVVVGFLGIVSVVGPFFASALDPTIILTSVLSTVWFLLVGLKLYKLGQPAFRQQGANLRRMDGRGGEGE